VGREKDQEDQEPYKLWVEYLKCSKGYADFCDLHRRRKKEPSETLPEELKNIKYLCNFFVFGDIHTPSWTFVKWWRHREKILGLLKGLTVRDYITRKILKVEPFNPAINHILFCDTNKLFTDYADIFGEEAKKCISQFKFHNSQREPTLHEFITIFPGIIKTGSIPQNNFSLGQGITLRINPQYMTGKNLAKAFQKILHERRKDSNIALKEASAIQYLRPWPRYKRLDELKKYLKVYKLKISKEKMLIKEVIKKMDPTADADNLDLQSQYRDFSRKAKKIITYVEMGVFPGHYDAVKKRK
jgi:hypothetical protein